ncbi:hypothetical protein CY34DRAFT_786973, partial [Suillus luteus UH-Slu-Lm8-n1]
KATKILDQALKEIGLKNDEIENLALERSATYRNCRLEDIKLPLLEGHLKNVPMEENFRKEVAMDVDDDDGTQRPRQVQDVSHLLLSTSKFCTKRTSTTLHAFAVTSIYHSRSPILTLASFSPQHLT